MWRNAYCIFCNESCLLSTNHRPHNWEYNFVGTKKKGTYIWYHKSCYLDHLEEQRQERERKENSHGVK